MDKKIRPYLVQRAKFMDTKIEDIVGIDSLLQMDYMGSSEFEFGGLTKSLRRMVANRKSYVMVNVDSIQTSEKLTMYVYGKGFEIEGVIDAATVLSKEKFGYKELCDMPDFVQGKNPQNDFWWDIVNDFMVCFGSENAGRVQIAMDKLAERWG